MKTSYLIVTSMILFNVFITSQSRKYKRPFERSVTVDKVQRRPSRLCKYQSEYVYCPGIGQWFNINMISRSAVMISISNNRIRTLDPWVMKRFKSLKYLEVNHNDIESLRGSLKENKNLVRFFANNNKLGWNKMQNEGSLKGAFKHNAKLQIVSLRQNGIRKLSSAIFDRRNNSLKSLDVSQNRIERLTRHTLTSMERLESLNLHQNNIMYLHRKAFQKNRRLRYLDLGSNRIAFVGRNGKLDLTNNRHLRALYLSNNRLDSLREVDLPQNVERLDVALNRIGRLERNALAHASKLMHLNASYNRIQTIHPKSLYYLKHLHTLDLSRNRIPNILPGTLKHLKNLQTLSLAYNDLTDLHEEMFSGNGRLVKLDLRGNSLASWQPIAFHGNVNLQGLDLRENNFTVSRSWMPDSGRSNENKGKSQQLDALDGMESRKTRRARKIIRRLRCLRFPASPILMDGIASGAGIHEASCHLIGQKGDETWVCGCE